MPLLVRQRAGPPEPSFPLFSEHGPHKLCPTSRTSSASLDPGSSRPETCDLWRERERTNWMIHYLLLFQHIYTLLYSTALPLLLSHSPVLFQLCTLSGFLRVSQLCCMMSPSASMPPALSVFVSSRFLPWKNGLQKNRMRTINSLPPCGSMVFVLQRECSHLLAEKLEKKVSSMC